MVGGYGDNQSAGAAWVFATPCELGFLHITPCTNIVATGYPGGPYSQSGGSYQVSTSTGTINYTVRGLNSYWLFGPTSGTATPSPSPLNFTVGATGSQNTLGPGTYGADISFSDSNTGASNPHAITATFTLYPAPLRVQPATNIVASGPQGGPFSPQSFSYTLVFLSGGVNYSENYSITNVPNWLTPSSTSGTVSSSGETTVTFTVNANANSLTPNTYVAGINFYNGHDNTTLTATLTVNPPPVLQVTPATNMVASATQGGPLPPTSFQYQLSASAGSVNYSISGVPNWLTPSSTSGKCVLFRYCRDLYGECKREQPRPRYLRPSHHHIHEYRHRTRYSNSDGDAHRQCACTASSAHHQYRRRRNSGRTASLFISIPTQFERRQR
jgi:hypothetical protein